LHASASLSLTLGGDVSLRVPITLRQQNIHKITDLSEIFNLLSTCKEEIKLFLIERCSEL
jgi:hypothetical protein